MKTYHLSTYGYSWTEIKSILDLLSKNTKHTFITEQRFVVENWGGANIVHTETPKEDLEGKYDGIIIVCKDGIESETQSLELRFAKINNIPAFKAQLEIHDNVMIISLCQDCCYPYYSCPVRKCNGNLVDVLGGVH